MKYQVNLCNHASKHYESSSCTSLLLFFNCTPSASFLFLKILAFSIAISQSRSFAIYFSFLVEDTFIDIFYAFYIRFLLLLLLGFAELIRLPWDPPTIYYLEYFYVVIVDIFDVEFLSVCSFKPIFLFL